MAQLRFNFRLDPTPGQIRDLARAFGCARVVYNDALALRRAVHASGGDFLPDGELQRQVITDAKRTETRAWLSEVSSVVLVQAVNDLNAAYRNFFASITGRRKGPRVGSPKFRSRKGRQAIRFTRNGFALKEDGCLYLAKIGGVAVRWSRELPSTPSSVTVVKDAAERYFASFVVKTDPAEDLARMPCAESEVGIDLGLASFAVFSDGSVIENPRLMRHAEKKLKKAQRALARKQKGSSNRNKAAMRVATVRAKVADARRDFHHKLSTTIVRENQAIYVEDLAVGNLARTRLAKSLYDAGWSSFVGMLEYKTARYGRTFIKIDRFAPTSQVCSECGVKDGPKPLAVRRWRCDACGARHDRDVNAARNVLAHGRQLVAAGRAETVNACGGDVRPVFRRRTSVKQEPTEATGRT